MTGDYPVNISLPVGLSFWRAKLLRPEGTARATAFEAGVGDREPPQPSARNRAFGFKFSHASKIWVSRSCRWLHPCLILPFGRSGSLARKTASPAGKAQKSFTKGKKLTNQTFQDHASKKNDNRRREAGRYKPLSEFPQDRECTWYEEAVLRKALPFGALWRLYL